jgi:hypothetical protein
MRYPWADALIPEAFEEHTVIFLLRPADAPAFEEAELERLQAEHLAYLRELARSGALIANGPLTAQTDERLRGLSVYSVPLPEALELARRDPMVRAGRLEIHGGAWLTADGTAIFGASDP